MLRPGFYPIQQHKYISEIKAKFGVSHSRLKGVDHNLANLAYSGFNVVSVNNLVNRFGSRFPRCEDQTLFPKPASVLTLSRAVFPINVQHERRLDPRQMFFVLFFHSY